MPAVGKKLKNINKDYIQIAGVLFLILLAGILLLFNESTSVQSVSATAAQVYFAGEYRIGDGEWQTIEAGKHIPASQGDVMLKGHFHMLTPDGDYIGIYTGNLPIAFYTNHISLTFVGAEYSYVIDHENPVYGDSACGQDWTGHYFTPGSEEPIEMLVHNPHKFGNENAIDEMLENVAIWGNIDFEKNTLKSGEPQRNTGILLMLVSVVFLGIALFSSLIHINNSRIIWLLGLVVLFAGSFITYTSRGISFWSESIIGNTTMIGASMMLYMLFVTMSIMFLLKKTKKIGNITLTVMVIVDAGFFILPIVTDMFFYDTWIWWMAAQLIANLVIGVCLIFEIMSASKKERLIYIGSFLPLMAFAADIVSMHFGWWKSGFVSGCVFLGMLAAAMIMVLRLIPHNINAASKAKALELERIVLHSQLTETRISTMMSQIRPHFIYNTLGSIEQLCKLDPPKAADLVHNFAKYLRGNFGELDNPRPILMSKEMEHVHHYISVENVRFPDMTFTFEMNSDDFRIPALTIQPIVENAIKHGLMKLPQGGSIRVISYETDTHYFISVVDDGAGFDPTGVFEDRKHVGLRNIRERLKIMVGGTLEIESKPGEGTKVTISIPKEEEAEDA